jgi:hypothetical protein
MFALINVKQHMRVDGGVFFLKRKESKSDVSSLLFEA